MRSHRGSSRYGWMLPPRYEPISRYLYLWRSSRPASWHARSDRLYSSLDWLSIVSNNLRSRVAIAVSKSVIALAERVPDDTFCLGPEPYVRLQISLGNTSHSH